ncbi:MAG: hypothetical protein Q9160_006979 [Pyrenula sp. 1 TL-2023]
MSDASSASSGDTSEDKQNNHERLIAIITQIFTNRALSPQHVQTIIGSTTDASNLPNAPLPPTERQRRSECRGKPVLNALWATFQSKHGLEMEKGRFTGLCLWLAWLQKEGYGAPVEAYDSFINDYPEFETQYQTDVTKLPGFRIGEDRVCIPSYFVWFLNKWNATKHHNLEAPLLSAFHPARVVEENPVHYSIMKLTLENFIADPSSTGPKAQ